MPPKKKAPAKKKGGYQMPEQFDPGFVLKDVYKKPWCLSKPIGQGGFGLIYIANRGEEPVKDQNVGDYVVKIEPKENGPLFCEIHFYTNCAKKDELEKFMSLKKLGHLAMPKYISSGTCTYKEKEYRFLVMDRYSTDLQRVLLKPEIKHQLSAVGVLCLMRQVLLALEYIHSRGYAHGDIKGANLMLKTDQEAYLVDYGLAYRFKRDNVHQKYEIKPDRRHNGTIEYTSRDAHDGAQISRRSDLEILGYCTIHWISGKLPWIDLIKNPVHVQESKKKSMSNVKEFLAETLGSVGESNDTIKFMEFYLNEVNKLQFDGEPDYAKIHNKITETLAALGHPKTAKDNFYVFNTDKNVSKKQSAKSAKVISEPEVVSELPKSKKRAVVSPKITSLKEKILVEEEESEIIDDTPKRKLPVMFDDTIEEMPKRSPIVKPKSSKQTKKVSNLVFESPVAESPRATPKRAAAIKASARNESINDTAEQNENKKENICVNENMLIKEKIGSIQNFDSPRRPVLIKKVKNKSARTISTQTDKSYLQDMRNRIRF